MNDEEKALMRKLVEALRRARPHVFAGPLSTDRANAVIAEIDQALIEADELIHWSDNA